MTLKKHMLFWLEALLFINLANAITTIEINISPVFYEGDAIEFSYTVISSEDETIVYSAEVNCEDKNIPRPLLEIKDVKLKENEPFKETYIFGKVSSSFISGNCDASVTISEPYFLSEQSQFRIETSPIFKFTAQTCKDMSCTKKTKVFKKGETIYLAYSSSVEDISVTSLLTYPDKTTKQ